MSEETFIDEVHVGVVFDSSASFGVGDGIEIGLDEGRPPYEIVAIVHLPL